MSARQPLDGRRIGLLEARKRLELSQLVARVGGVPICAPALREAQTDVDLAPLLADVIAGRFDVAVVLTAAAMTTLCDAAERLRLLPDLREALGHMVLACRGPKPQLVLRRLGVSPGIVTATPHTGAELIEALSEATLKERSVLLLHYGERNDALSAAISGMGARVTDAYLYEWHLPDDVEPIRALIRLAVERELDALLFTSQVQCRHLFLVASEMGIADRLLQALQQHVAIGAIGPTCASALRVAGIVPDLIPSLPNSPSLVRALADYFDLIHERGDDTARAAGDTARVLGTATLPGFDV